MVCRFDDSYPWVFIYIEAYLLFECKLISDTVSSSALVEDMEK